MAKRVKKAIAVELKRLLVGKTVKCIIFNSEVSGPDFALHGGFGVKLIEISPKRESLEFKKGTLHDGVVVHLDLVDVIEIINVIDDAYMSLNTKIGQVDFVIEKQEDLPAPEPKKKRQPKKPAGDSKKAKPAKKDKKPTPRKRGSRAGK